MGAWGVGSFENDSAADFIADILDGGDLSLVREAFDNVITSTEYLEARDACEAIVSAEVIAAVMGRPTAVAESKQKLMQWISSVQPSVEPALVAQAKEALIRILAPNSELSELWEESDEFSEWQACVNELLQQL